MKPKTMSGAEFKQRFRDLIASLEDNDEVFFGSGDLSLYEVTEVTCPHCGHKQGERLGHLKSNPVLICRRCRGAMAVDADQLRRKIEQVEQALADINGSLRRALK